MYRKAISKACPQLAAVSIGIKRQNRQHRQDHSHLAPCGRATLKRGMEISHARYSP